MNRRGFLASAIAVVLAPKELIIDTFDPMGGTFSNVIGTPSDLTEASLEQILIDIQKHVSPRGPIAFLPNAVRYTWDEDKINFQIVRLYDYPKIIPRISHSRDVVSPELIGKCVDFEVHVSNVQDGVGLRSERHPSLGRGIGSDWCEVCEGYGGIAIDDEGNDYVECHKCGV